MTKEWLISFIAERARISPQRAELAYEAFWEAILSELKSGHFSLPCSGGTINLKEKPNSGLKEMLKTMKSPSGAPAKSAKATPSKTAVSKGKAAPASKTASKKAEAAKPVKKAPAKKVVPPKGAKKTAPAPKKTAATAKKAVVKQAAKKQAIKKQGAKKKK